MIRTILVTAAASVLAGLAAYLADRLLGLGSLTVSGGGAGSLVQLLVIGIIMLPVVCGVLPRRPGSRRGRSPGGVGSPNRPGDSRSHAAIVPTPRDRPTAPEVCHLP